MEFPDFILDPINRGRHLLPFRMANEAQRLPASHPRPLSGSEPRRRLPGRLRRRPASRSNGSSPFNPLPADGSGRAGRSRAASSASRPRAPTGPRSGPPLLLGDAAGGAGSGRGGLGGGRESAERRHHGGPAEHGRRGGTPAAAGPGRRCGPAGAGPPSRAAPTAPGR